MAVASRLTLRIWEGLDSAAGPSIRLADDDLGGAQETGIHRIATLYLFDDPPILARYRQRWQEHHGSDGQTAQETVPKIGLVNHIVLAETDAEAVRIVKPAWDEYMWNLEAPCRLEGEQHGLPQFLGASMNKRP